MEDRSPLQTHAICVHERDKIQEVFAWSTRLQNEENAL